MYDELTDLFSTIADNFLSVIGVIAGIGVLFGVLVIVGLPKSVSRRARRHRRR